MAIQSPMDFAGAVMFFYYARSAFGIKSHYRILMRSLQLSSRRTKGSPEKKDVRETQNEHSQPRQC